ncbi:ATP-binding protein [Undibacterium sp.]|uniref:ATP-binding protein n=1 Tax=Undibacterium sp. TaxID=1914977 RepID=UPI0025E1FF17|nr:ATP-binding protein [Undibacterium sp.]
MRWPSFNLRQTLIVGTVIGMLLPALLLMFFQLNHKFEKDVDLRIRAPMSQYANVLSRGLGASIWNMDNKVAQDLIDAVMRNPDVVSITVSNEYGDIFASKQNSAITDKAILRETREIFYNDARVGQLVLELTTARIERELWSELFSLATSLAAQVLFSIGFIWILFERRLVQPLLALQAAALRLARGDLKQELHWNRLDEIGSLASGLESMRSDLAKLIAEGEQKTASLQNELLERKRVEQALGLSQEKFSAIFDASPVAMSVSRFDGEHEILEVNNAWCQLFQRERHHVIEKSGSQIGVWAEANDRQRFIETLIRDDAVSGFSAWLKTSELALNILCEISGKVIRLGEQKMLILAFEDITSKHQYESNILALNSSLEQRVSERTQELSKTLERLTVTQSELARAEKMSALGSLVAGISHELNTPIGNSLTVASTLQDHTKNITAEMAGKGLTRSRLDAYIKENRDGTAILTRSLHHAAELITSFKQVAVDQTSEHRRSFNLDATIAEILLTLGPSLRKTSHTVETDIPNDIVMESYPGPLGQVINNLIRNALIHAFEGRQNGLISISAKRQELDQIELRVCDNGVGIAAENLARVFDPFFTTKLGQGGSGLGLNIVYNLVTTALHGSISLDSELGHGCCFSLSIPRVAPNTASQSNESSL